ncbi:MAG: A24 family peptidase, partial [Deltaproteobacteria bacterium]|nr:A24 family peptidase [Deltaproteobacteria bacterium]
MLPWTWYAAVAFAAVAATTDVRRGVIPNWLTLPVLVGMPVVWLVSHGPVAMAYSILSAAACALVPFVLYRFGAAGGGDVKLLAGLGALVGLDLG